MKIFSIFFFLPILLLNSSHFNLKQSSLEVTSPNFQNDSFIPIRYTLFGDNVSPELHILNIPSEAKSLALIVEDIDAPRGIFIHWLVKNIQITEIIPENFNSGVELINSWGYNKYGGPKPPKGKIHRYYFRIYAITTETMDCKNLDEFRKEVQEKKISEGFLLGKYEAK